VVAYADTSFLVSLYGQDANSAKARDLVTDLGMSMALTPLQRHEARNALRLAAFRKEITSDQCAAVLALLDADIENGVLVPSPVAWAEVYDRAEYLSASHSAVLGTRAMDVLHVAAAATLGIQEFLTFDHRQRTLAVEVGMHVQPVP
jgi:predicted nucleic acid-binding protein